MESTTITQKIRGIVLAIVICAPLLYLAWTLFGGMLKVESEKPQHVEVERVISGHYVKVKPSDKLIYAGIRCPYKNEPFHEESTKRNAALVADKELRLRFDTVERDKKKRLVAYAYVDGQMVNEQLVRDGLAFVRLTPGARRFADTLLAAQNDARKNKRGLWSQPPRTPEDEYPADPKYGNFHRPSCEEVPKINPERRIVLNDKNKAFDLGFAPCTKCLP